MRKKILPNARICEYYITMVIKPSKIQVSRSKGNLIIQWEDDRESVYPLSGLRAACPCAECKGGHENMGQPGSPDMLELPLSVDKSSDIDKVELVGNYALQLIWQDGHSYGIYSWEFLRDLDPASSKE